MANDFDNMSDQVLDDLYSDIVESSNPVLISKVSCTTVVGDSRFCPAHYYNVYTGSGGTKCCPQAYTCYGSGGANCCPSGWNYTVGSGNTKYCSP